jgi:hypothetical protein
MTPTTRSRLILLAIVTMFLVPFFAAVVMRFSGWEPERTRNFGELLEPPVPLQQILLTRADGSDYVYEPVERRWQLIVFAPAECGQPCLVLADTIYRVWLGEGRKAAKVRVLWFGPVPQGIAEYSGFIPMRESTELMSTVPMFAASEAGLPVYLVDPSGFLVMRYARGFDPSGLRKDLGRLIK